MIARTFGCTTGKIETSPINDMGLVLLQVHVEVGQAGRLRQLILALIEKRAALAHIVQNGVEIGDLLRGQRFPGPFPKRTPFSRPWTMP